LFSPVDIPPGNLLFGTHFAKTMNGIQKILCTPLCLLLAAISPCRASFIQMHVVPGCTFKAQGLTVTLSISNKGDEAAHEIVAEALLNGGRGLSSIHPVLEAGQSFQTTIAIRPPPLDDGVHTVIVQIHYMDRTGNPFTAMTTLPVVTEIPPLTVEPMEAHLTSVTMRQSGTIDLTITNRTAADIEAFVQLALPDELDGLFPKCRLTIPAHSHCRESVTLRNVSALKGSRYAVVAIVDYRKDGLHYSTVAASRVHIQPRTSPLLTHRRALLVLLTALIAGSIAGPLRRRLIRCASASPPSLPDFADRFFAPVILLIMTGLVLVHLHPAGILSNTMTVGGDTPAHNYLASQLKQQLCESGRLIGWSQGWWGGFPLFQFYFCLPYLLIAVLSFLLPFNIAFKLVSVSGILLLPTSAFFASRRMRLTFPLPILLSISTIALLFDPSHTMWGVNIYSTLAGMIANSLSFAIMLMFIASAARDADDGRFRVRSVLLFACLLASHFFTTVMAVLTLALVPFLTPRAGFIRAVRVLASECTLGALLMAWWLVPLIAKHAYGVDFGVNWELDYATVLSPFMSALLPLSAIAIVAVLLKRFRTKNSSGRGIRLFDEFLTGVDPATGRFVLMTGFMLIAALLLFLFGYDLSPVFVNVRLWPFITYATLATAAAGCSIFLKKLRNPKPATVAILVAVLLWGTGKPVEIMQWAEWNYDGIERKGRWPVFRDLVLPLAGTPGRLANDLHDYNASLGSSRIFEATPHRTGKPILEGGIVNSAAGSLLSYYIQSETSDHCAGFPPIVKPATFSITNATRHLALLNVKHFIARSARTKRALAESTDWAFLRESQGWELYELTTHDGRYVFVPDFEPTPLLTANWKETALEWMYRTNRLDHFFVLLDEEKPPPPRFAETSHNRPVLRTSDQGLPAPGAIREEVIPTLAHACISEEKVTARGIRFKTNAIGAPHIIKSTYFPNWKVRGAEGVYMVTPCFMLVYPTAEEVELYYGYTLSDTIGHVLALLGAALLGIAVLTRKTR